MTYASCPTDVVNAPVEIVWSLLTDPAGWGDFYDMRVLRVDPPGPASVGQRLSGESGPRVLHLGISFEYTDIDPEHHRLGVNVKLPLGITVREDMDLVALGETKCRVNYHCNFELPTGFRGWVTRRMLGRELDEGPVDSLRRLKAAAERRVSGGA